VAHTRRAALLFEVEAFEYIDQRIKMRGSARCLSFACERNRGAHFESHCLGEFVVSAFVYFYDPAQQRDAIRDLGIRVRRECPARSDNRAINIIWSPNGETSGRQLG